MPHGLLNHYHCRVAPLGCPCGQAEGLCHLVSRRVVNSASQIGARLCSGLRQQATDLSCWSAQRGRWSVAPWPASRGREAVRARPKFLAAASALPLRRHWLAANPERAWNDQRLQTKRAIGEHCALRPVPRRGRVFSEGSAGGSEVLPSAHSRRESKQAKCHRQEQKRKRSTGLTISVCRCRGPTRGARFACSLSASAFTCASPFSVRTSFSMM